MGVVMALDFTLADEHKLVKESVRGMLQKWMPRRQELREMARRERGVPQELGDDFAAMGLTGCLVPQEYGGNEAGLLALTLAFEELTTNGFSPGLLLVTAMDTSCILKNGTEEQKRRFLPDIAGGRTKFCFAVTEPDAGSNTFRIKTAARRDGGNYVLNGQKIFISGVDAADSLLG